MEELLSILASILTSAARPLHVDRLVREAIAGGWRLPRSANYFRPHCRYEPGARFAYEEGRYEVVAAAEAANSRQGRFQVLEVHHIQHQERRRLAAAVRRAPAAAIGHLTLTEMEALYREKPAELRRHVLEAVAGDARFVLRQCEAGDFCAWRDLLPVVDDLSLQQIRQALLQAAPAQELRPLPTKQLLLLWASADGVSDKELHAFALEAALQELQDVIYISGAGWVMSDAWTAVCARPALLGPRMPNILPAFLDEGEVEDEAASGGNVAGTSGNTDLHDFDVDTWRAQRGLEGRFTLRPTHFYRHFLPLNRSLRPIVPSWPTRVTIHYHFSGQQGHFAALVDPTGARVLAGRDMTRALADNGVYPGAILALSHRGTDFDYDLRTLPLAEPRLVKVRRLFRDEKGELEMVDDEELLTYEVDGAAFVAGARWEDVEALFLQAEQVGKGIFSLMYLACWQRLLNSGREVTITARALFDAVHFAEGGRLTSLATISRELSRRLAFEPIGDGRFRFRPQYGAALVHSTAEKRPTITPELGAPIAGVERSGRRSRDMSLDAWSVLSRDKHRREVLARMVGEYTTDGSRQKVLFIRDLAHRRIRRLLAEGALAELTLATFNRQVWRLGVLIVGDRRLRLDSDETVNFLRRMALPALEQAVEAGHLRATGNQSWSSGSAVFAPSLALPLPEKTNLMRSTLRELLYSSIPVETRIRRALRFGNGFGINSVSGILHVMVPETYIVFNRRAAEVLRTLGFTLPGDWDRNVELYLSYCAFCRDLRDTFGFESLADVDWFIYRWGAWGSAIGGLLTTDGAQDLQAHVPRQLTLFDRESPEQDERHLSGHSG